VSSGEHHSHEILEDGQVRLQQVPTFKSTRLSWERPLRTVLIVLKPGNPIVTRYADTVGKWMMSKALVVCFEEEAHKELPEFESLEALLRKLNITDPALIVDFIVTLGGDGKKTKKTKQYI
jgi:hypothetical protein